MVEDDALYEHPEKHGGLPVLDQRVERLAQEGLEKKKKKAINIICFVRNADRRSEKNGGARCQRVDGF